MSMTEFHQAILAVTSSASQLLAATPCTAPVGPAADAGISQWDLRIDNSGAFVSADGAVYRGVHAQLAARDAEIAELRTGLAAVREELDSWRFTNRIDDLQRQLERAQAARTAVPVELAGVEEQLKRGSGFWRSCSGCYETEDGHPVGRYAFSQVMNTALGCGCSECGGLGAIWDNTDYAAFAEQTAQPASSISAEGNASNG